MFKIYNRYIALIMAPSFFMIALVITAIVWIMQIARLLYLIDKGILFCDFLGLVVLVLPSLLFIILPFVTTLSTIYAYQRLSEERQLTILKNSGLSNFQLAKPALFVALITSIFAFYLSAELMPYSYIKLKKQLDVVKNDFISNIITEKSFNKISKYVTIYIDKKLSNGEFAGVILFDDRKNDLKPTIVFANFGHLQIQDQNPILLLTNGTRQSYDSKGNFTRLVFESLLLELKHNTTDNIDKSLSKDINEYYINELLNPDSRLSEQRRNRLNVEGHQRVIWVVYNLIFTFIALSVFLYFPYNKRTQYKSIAVTTAIILLVTILHFYLQNMAIQNFNYIYAIYTNCVLSILSATYLYNRRLL